MDQAQLDLQKGDEMGARSQLTQASGKLLSLYQQVPTGRLVQVLGTTHQQVERELALTRNKKVLVDIEPLVAEMKRMDEYLDPKVAQVVKDGLKAQRNGDSQTFAKDLQKAQLMVSRDTASWPLEDAYARVVAARDAFDQGQTHLAARLLAGVHDAVAQTMLQSPLVPIRFSLRAAAAAQDSDNPIRADKLTRQAADDLRSLSRDVQAAPKLQSLTNKADNLSMQLDSGKNVSPDDLRKLAAATYGLVPQRRG